VVSDADFNALKNLVQQMNGQLQSLEQTNQLDQQTIQQLQQQLGETQKTAANAEQKSTRRRRPNRFRGAP
jgi:conjugal transfer/entry exclusion protein